MNRRGGFTLIEAAASSAILGLILLGGVLVIRSSLGVVRGSLVRGNQLVDKVSASEKVQRPLLLAGLSTLEYKPPTGALEPMFQGNSSDHIGFRRISGLLDGSPVYDPPVTQSPHEMYFVPVTQVSNVTVGNLVYSENGNDHVMATHVSRVYFRHEGNGLLMEIDVVAQDDGKLSIRRHRCLVVLRVP